MQLAVGRLWNTLLPCSHCCHGWCRHHSRLWHSCLLLLLRLGRWLRCLCPSCCWRLRVCEGVGACPLCFCMEGCAGCCPDGVMCSVSRVSWHRLSHGYITLCVASICMCNQQWLYCVGASSWEACLHATPLTGVNRLTVRACVLVCARTPFLHRLSSPVHCQRPEAHPGPIKNCASCATKQASLPAAAHHITTSIIPHAQHMYARWLKAQGVPCQDSQEQQHSSATAMRASHATAITMTASPASRAPSSPCV